MGFGGWKRLPCLAPLVVRITGLLFGPDVKVHFVG